MSIVDPQDPTNHDKPLWVVYGVDCAPSLLCAKLRAYSRAHVLLPVGLAGAYVAIWGFSVYEGEPGFRTLGIRVSEWSKRSTAPLPIFYDDHDEALDHLRRLTTPTP